MEGIAKLYRWLTQKEVVVFENIYSLPDRSIFSVEVGSPNAELWTHRPFVEAIKVRYKARRGIGTLGEWERDFNSGEIIARGLPQIIK